VFEARIWSAQQQAPPADSASEEDEEDEEDYEGFGTGRRDKCVMPPNRRTGLRRFLFGSFPVNVFFVASISFLGIHPMVQRANGAIWPCSVRNRIVRVNPHCMPVMAHVSSRANAAAHHFHAEGGHQTWPDVQIRLPQGERPKSPKKVRRACTNDLNLQSAIHAPTILMHYRHTCTNDKYASDIHARTIWSTHGARLPTTCHWQGSLVAAVGQVACL
jgi:hypothetical protein